MGSSGGAVLVLAVLGLALGCASPRPAPQAPADARAPFRFDADTFAFANVTVWEYGVDPVSRTLEGRPREVSADFVFRCGAMARAVRQFYLGARFDPAAPRLDAAGYAARIAQVLAGDPRRAPAERVVIPGYADLRSFSSAQESALKEAIGSPLQSYLQRGNWRMIFPFPPGEQADAARRIATEVAAGRPAILHLTLFPEQAINHFVVAYAVEETRSEIRFTTYDPNDAAKPVPLVFDRAARSFSFAATESFAGGVVKAYEVYRNALF